VLTIGKIGGADADGRSAGYYTASVAKGRDDYYTGRGEAPGEWFGAACGALGLVGEVDAEDFRSTPGRRLTQEGACRARSSCGAREPPRVAVAR
jgi:hypothetical protein